MKGRVNKIMNASKKTGVKTLADGRVFTWNIMTVEVIDEDGNKVVADSFDTLDVGSQVVITRDGEYTNAKLYKPDSSDAKLDEILDCVKRIEALLQPVPKSVSPNMEDEKHEYGE